MSNGACTHDRRDLKGLIMGDGDDGESQLRVCRLVCGTSRNNVIVVLGTHERAEGDIYTPGYSR